MVYEKLRLTKRCQFTCERAEIAKFKAKQPESTLGKVVLDKFSFFSGGEG